MLLSWSYITLMNWLINDVKMYNNLKITFKVRNKKPMGPMAYLRSRFYKEQIIKPTHLVLSSLC